MKDGWRRNGSYIINGHLVAWVTGLNGDWWGHLASGRADFFATRRGARAWCERKLEEEAEK